ncbi:MAG: hypothetical protein ABIQ18_47180, partial [Umezawaea sp.]
FTLSFGIGSLVAITLTATDGWPNHTIANSVGGLLFYTVPFTGLIWFTVVDLRRLRRTKKM